MDWDEITKQMREVAAEHGAKVRALITERLEKLVEMLNDPEERLP